MDIDLCRWLIVVAVTGSIVFTGTVFIASHGTKIVAERAFAAGVTQVQEEAIDRGLAVYHHRTKEFFWLSDKEEK